MSLRSAAPDESDLLPELRLLAVAILRGDARAPFFEGEAAWSAGRVVRDRCVAADLAGRAALLDQVAAPKPLSFALRWSSIDEAAESLVQRRPTLAASWDEVRAVYDEDYARGVGEALAIVVQGRIGEALSEVGNLSASAVLAREAQDALADLLEETAFSAARATSVEQLEAIQKRLAKAIRTGGDTRDLAKKIAAVNDWTLGYAENVVRTNTTSALAQGTLREALRLEIEGEIAGLRFDAVNDRDTRPNHAAADGFVARASDPAWTILRPPLGFNCFMPGTLVQGRVFFASRMAYSGEVVKVTTKSGRVLALTPNHPVVTVHALLPAGEIEVGHHLLRYLGHEDGPTLGPARHVNEEHGPARVEEVFRALAEHGDILRCRVVADDLHGDAVHGEGEVDVVAVHGMLLDGLAAEQGESARQVSLVVEAPSDAGPGNASGLARRDAERVDGGAGLAAGRVVRPGDLALSGVGGHGSPLEPLRLGLASRLECPTLEAKTHDAPAHAKLVRELVHGVAGLVETDEVVHVERYTHSGHVYDLQTETGWVVAGDFFASNCRCSVGPELGDVPRRARIPPGAAPDPGFRGARAAAANPYP